MHTSEQDIKLCLIDYSWRQRRCEKYLNFLAQCVEYRFLAFHIFSLRVISFLQPRWSKVAARQSPAYEIENEQVLQPCKRDPSTKHTYHYFRDVNPKKYCPMYIPLPCLDAQAFCVTSGRRRKNVIDFEIQAFLSKE
jgi:hypothetical protein